MEFLIGVLLRYPGFWQQAGLALASLSFGAVLLGLRLGRRIERAEQSASRVGASIEIHLDKLLPWWLSPFVPESALGYTAWMLMCVCGLVLAYSARKIKRLYH